MDIVDGSDVLVDDVVTLVLNTCTWRLDNNLIHQYISLQRSWCVLQ